MIPELKQAHILGIIATADKMLEVEDAADFATLRGVAREHLDALDAAANALLTNCDNCGNAEYRERKQRGTGGCRRLPHDESGIEAWAVIHRDRSYYPNAGATGCPGFKLKARE